MQMRGRSWESERGVLYGNRISTALEAIQPYGVHMVFVLIANSYNAVIKNAPI
jgi:hypothetical protein